MYLILAQDEDVHADAVLFYLKKYGKNVRRFDIATLFDEYSAADHYENRSSINIDIGVDNGRLIFENGDIIDSSQIRSILSRSFYIPKSKENAPTTDHLATAEIRTALKGLFSLVPDSCKWINNPYIEEKVDNKIFQHSCARRLGLKVPDTIITNDPVKARAFFDNHQEQVIIKQLSEISLIDEKPYINKEGYNDIEFKGFYTSKVLREDLNDLDDCLGPGSAPVFFQECLKKKSELRVTVIGDKCFTYRIFSQENEKSRIDFRHVDDLRTEPCDLPDTIKNKILNLMQNWGLEFATIDLVETENNEIVFLEANVVGNWLWLEIGKNGSQIAQAIADYMIKE